MNILHGLKLQPTRERQKIPNGYRSFTYGVRFNPEMAASVDRIAAQYGVNVSDVVRTAVAAFLTNSQLADAASVGASVSDRSAPTAPHPAKHDAYRGDGRSDFAETQRVNQRNRQHKGGRLVDKSPVR